MNFLEQLLSAIFYFQLQQLDIFVDMSDWYYFMVIDLKWVVVSW